ncbi:class I SAM-dependent methyltransferase [Pedobacter nutrimenti]|uniref:class I SAM-dependent methyltransferase n=1 Tax=Pedobacter nutrimenti TaxID=1241337 RepID=UPI00292DD6F7|nr:methyltransferase domain-containing protein [Pedobacter nutrimenti]
MVNNYDRIAKYYDFLSRTVFFKAQVNAQTEQLPFIPQESKILIVGGGTGWILSKIAELQPKGLRITYIEISSEMIALARKRDVKENSIELINSSIEDYHNQKKFDVILTAFLFDNFSREKAELVFHKLHNSLKAEGLWLFSDFSYQPKIGKIWQYMMLKIMYFFFRMISNVEARELPDIGVYFKKNKYKKMFRKRYYRNFIKATVYQKTSL